MARIYNAPKVRIDAYGKPIISLKASEDFIYLVGMRVSDIILFEDGNEDLIKSGATILPRHYIIFVGTKDGEIQYKPYEFNQYRIVVSTYKDIIMNIDSIG